MAEGTSKYAEKLRRRRKLANQMGVADAPLPILMASQEQIGAAQAEVDMRSVYYDPATTPAERAEMLERYDMGVTEALEEDDE